MELKILELSERKARFEVLDTTPAIANALRRTLINDIPKLAIHEVEFHHGQIRDTEGNVFDSAAPLFDEMISHRLGLIPLKSDLSMNFRDECSCGGEGCPLCTVMYSLFKVGDANTGEPVTVYSGDLTALGDKTLGVVDPLIPIVKLKSNQGLLIYAKAVMGTAKEHAKWQVTHGVAYKYHREYEIPAKEPVAAKIKKECPQCVIKSGKDKLIVTDDIPCKPLREYMARYDVPNKVDESRIIIDFETDGSLTAQETLEYAVKKLKERFAGMRNNISIK